MPEVGVASEAVSTFFAMAAFVAVPTGLGALVVLILGHPEAAWEGAAFGALWGSWAVWYTRRRSTSPHP